MARRKTVTTQTLIGERGLTLIANRCLEMGHLFHPRRVDHGIDGHIDLVDPETGAVLNLTLLVQSKASTRPFSHETEDELRYICDERDLDLWLSGNAPVLLVLSHPDDGAAWWVYVKSAFADAGRRATRTVVIDKHSQRFDAAASRALLELAVPKSSGLYLRPPPIPETLETNLLPILETPPVLYVARAAVQDYRAAGAALAKQQGRREGWLLRDGLVVSFADLRESRLRALCDGDVEQIDVAEWASTTDIDLQNRFKDLLARTLESAYPDLRWHNARRHVHFRATSTLGPRKAGKGRRSRGRTVFAPHFAKSDPTRVSYYHHAALRTRFRRIEGTWFCELDPDYCFTSDGYTESRYADTLLAGIKRLDRHPAVAGWTRAWANFLRGEGDLFTAEQPLRFGELATVSVDRGIDEKWWGAAPAEALSDTDQGTSRDGDAVAQLAAADVDTDDLVSMVAEPDRSQTSRRARRRPTGSGRATSRDASGGSGAS